METHAKVPETPPLEENRPVSRESGPGARADFISSLAMFLVGAATIVESLRMPKYDKWDSYTQPGFTPIFFGALMCLFSGIILVRSLRAHGYRLGLTATGISDTFLSYGATRLMFVLGMIMLFLLLMGHIHFGLNSAIFLFATMYFFKAGKWYTCLTVATIFSVAIWFLFVKIFLVPLP